MRYIATISNGKSRGEVELEDGIGNADFNAGLKKSIAASDQGAISAIGIGAYTQDDTVLRGVEVDILY